MKTTTKTLMAGLGLISALMMNVNAQTTWIGADAASLTTGTNWSASLPTLLSTGTIPNGTLGINFNGNLTDWVVIQNGGAVTTTSFRQFNGGSWTMNGGSMSLGNNFQLVTADNRSHTFTVNAGASASTTASLLVSSAGTNRSATLNISGGSVSSNGFTVDNGGTVNFSSGTLENTGATTINVGGSVTMSGGTRTGREITNNGKLTISGGSFSTNSDRAITTNAGATTTISGGTVSLGNQLGSIKGAGSYVFEGGTTTGSGAISTSTGFSLTLGGTSAGSLTATGWAGTTAAREVDWLAGTGMSMTLSGAANWAETEWTADRMFFNGDSGSTLGLTWAQVIDPGVGFNSGGGTHFDWDGTSRTLSLVTIPEPSTFLLVGLTGLAALFLRRRRG